MDILKKEFAKYSKPMFFNIGRVATYLLALLLLLGIFTRRNDSQFILVNLFVFGIITLILLIFDIINSVNKIKSYKSHKVQFFDNHILFVDHRGTFVLPYEDLKSYQLLSDQLLLRIQRNKFVISAKQHGIMFEELRQMVSYLDSKEVLNKNSRGYMYLILLFLAINYGLDYLIRSVFELSADASLFGTLYVIFFIGIVFLIVEKWNLRNLKAKEE